MLVHVYLVSSMYTNLMVGFVCIAPVGMFRTFIFHLIFHFQLHMIHFELDIDLHFNLQFPLFVFLYCYCVWSKCKFCTRSLFCYFLAIFLFFHQFNLYSDYWCDVQFYVINSCSVLASVSLWLCVCVFGLFWYCRVIRLFTYRFCFCSWSKML